MRHSDATCAHVEVAQERPGRVLVVVENNGHVRQAPIEGAGTGLRGLQERVGLLGGALGYGPHGEDAAGKAGGGWRMEARIPWART